MFQTVDARGVELSTRRLMLQVGSISIGPDGPGGLSFSWGIDSTMDENYLASGGFTTQGAQFSVVFGQERETFTFTGSASNAVFAQDQGRGATLSYNQSTNTFTYVSADGLTATFDTPSSSFYVLRSVTHPTGEKLTYYYGSTFRTVTSSLGYQLRLGLTNYSGTNVITSAVVFNMADETCDPTAASCTLVNTWPSLTRNFSTGVFTDSLNRQTQVAGNSGGYTITYPTGRSLSVGGSYTSDAFAASYFQVASLSDGAGTWTYVNPAPPYAPPSALVFGPGNSAPEQYQFNSAGRLTFYHSAEYSGNFVQVYNGYDSKNRMTSHSVNDGATSSGTTYAYDARGNLTESRQISTTPGTPTDIVSTAYYDPSCANPKICNQPIWTRDAKGNQTDYTYVATTGQVATVTAPADANGIRPKTTYSYTNYQAYYRNASGTIVASGFPVSLVSGISSCRTTASCVGTADESRTTFYYGLQNGTANNLLAASTDQMIGNTIIATTAFAYNRTGDVVTADGPLAADTQRSYYDVMRQQTGAIGPDPDGSGGALFSATRITYNGEGQPTKTETGTANNQSDTGMSGFAAITETNTTYNGQGRVATQSAAAGGTTYALTQYSYLANGLPQCAAQRMNPATYGALPASACSLATQGSDGPDRITQKAYDNSYRVTSITTGLGTTAQAVEETRTYDALGRLSTITDAENNKTTYVYDGMNRIYQTRFPSPTKGSGTSSTTDYEQLGYDPNGNVTSFRTRAGETLTMTYDNLNRLIVKDVPYRASMPANTRDVYFRYDLFGNMTDARFDSASGEGVVNAFDALGRMTSTTTNMDSQTKTLGYLYDAAGNRTRLTYPDGNYVNYYRTSAGALYYTDLNSTSPLFYAPPDSAGRLSVIYRWNTSTSNWGPYTVFGYDAISRLSSQSFSFTTPSYNSTTTLAYNPASQITSRTSTNDLLAWNGSVNVNRAYVPNGLNQYSTVAGNTFAYDANGNLTSDGTSTFSYDVENRMVGTTTGTTSYTLRYDPLGRLYEFINYSSGVQQWGDRWVFDGDALVTEHSLTGAIIARYVHGTSGGDDPLVAFNGAAVTDNVRRYFFADERGSIAVETLSEGTVNRVSAYDEYGIPKSNFNMRWGYTGQAMVAGMWYYKARFYSPTLGRFMQTDPIGYGDGMNMYAYVGNDPINLLDPLGLSKEWCGYVTTSPGSVTNSVDSKGDPVITVTPPTTSFQCMNVPGDDKPWDGPFDNANIPTNPGDEKFWRLRGGKVEVTKPGHKWTCGSGKHQYNQFEPPAGFFEPGDPGTHTHPDGYDPALGPHDGVAAFVSGGTAYMQSTEGLIRVNYDPSAASPFSLSLISGHWAMRPSDMRALIDQWNKGGGASAGGSGTAGCHQNY